MAAEVEERRCGRFGGKKEEEEREEMEVCVRET